jgi:predicted nucleic acid-binding protein
VSSSGSPCSTAPSSGSGGASGRAAAVGGRANGAGGARISTGVAALVDTNVLVYRYDARFPKKQRAAARLLREGIAADDLRLPHQALIEFVAATTRPIAGRRILELADALREAEELLSQFEVLYPNEAIVRTAVRGCATYGLSWFDAHLWAYAEHHGLSPLYSEDFEHGRMYGTVRVVDPFRA